MSHYSENKEKYKAKALANNRRYVERNRAHARAAADVPCTDCGERYPYYVMDFDHVRGEKNHTVCFLAAQPGSLAKLQEEIEKCEVVCSNCHRIRTHNRGYTTPVRVRG